MRSRIVILVLSIPMVTGGSLLLGVGRSERAARPSIGDPDGNAILDRLPAYFVENRGQLAGGIDFATLGGLPMAFTDQGIQVRLEDQAGTSQAWGLHLDFLGAGPSELEGLSKEPAVVSSFTGDRGDWAIGARTYSGVTYRDLWPGIDLNVEGQPGRLKYRFVVAPGADPSDIRMRWRGATGLGLDRAGDLEVRTPAGTLIDEAPVTFQRSNPPRQAVPTSYVLEGSRLGFDVGDYDRSRRLVIDPALVFGGYIGGSLSDGATGIAVDAAGNSYAAGTANSPEASFPVVLGPDTSQNGLRDAFVAKVNAAGTGLVYAGYIGGDLDDEGREVAVDAAGSAYLTGYTESTEATFPDTIGPDTSFNGDTDAFVAKVNAAGTGLVYAGYIGGTLEEFGNGIAVDGAGAAYVAGRAVSDQATFPETVGPDLTQNGDSDAFVAKVVPSGASLAYAGYIGGDLSDVARDVAVDPAGNAYVVGDVDSDETTFPDGDGFGGVGGPDTSFNGDTDAFVAKVNAAGAGLTYAGYIGGDSFDFGNGAAVGPDGTAYVAGFTASGEATFPETVGPDLTRAMGDDAYVARLNAAGTALIFAGFIGGDGGDFGQKVAVDASGAAYVTGYTNSDQASFPILDAPDPTANGANDAFITKVFSAGTGFAYSGFIGGADEDSGENVAVDPGGAAYVAGRTSSDQATFPVLVGPDTTYNGLGDGFVAKIATTEICKGRPVTHLGSDGNDQIVGSPGKDVVLALGGKDRVGTKGGADRVCAGSGNDKVRGGGGNDLLLGQGGRDALNGGAGKRDKCVGGPGKDTGKGCERGRV